jgi:hypothetical protein
MARPTGTELHRSFGDVIRLPIDGGDELVYAPLSRAASIVGPDRMRLLLAAGRFATLDDHAARIAARDGRDPADLLPHLGWLVRAGLLVPVGDLMDRIRASAPAEDPPPRIASIGIPTRDRPESLRAALASYVENLRAHGREVEWVVADDAASAEGRAQTRAAAAEVGKRYGVPVSYLGLEEKLAYAAAVAAHAGVPEEVAAFAIANPDGYPLTSGSNRNALLLHTAGDVVAQVDDDTRARIAPVPGQLPGLALTSQDDPSEKWFPGPDEPILPDRVVVDRAYPSFHEDLLGKTVAACVEDRRRDGLDLAGASGRFFHRLAPGGRVRMTQIGCAGDTGTGSMWFLLLQSGRSRERLLASEAAYRHAFTRRQIVRAAPRASITDGMFCMSMSIGLDARALLPPFLPVQRNCDGLFGIALRLCFPGAFSAFLPWVTEHTPSPPRTASFEAFFQSVAETASEDALCGLVAGSRVEHDRRDPRVGLRALGAMLERWGSLPLDQFEELSRVQVMRARSLDVAILDEAKRRHGGAPAYWARDVDETIARLRDALPRPSLALPVDLVRAFGDARGREANRRMVRRYGEVLRCWPDLWDAALDLRRRGVRPGVALG